MNYSGIGSSLLLTELLKLLNITLKSCVLWSVSFLIYFYCEIKGHKVEMHSKWLYSKYLYHQPPRSKNRTLLAPQKLTTHNPILACGNHLVFLYSFITEICLLNTTTSFFLFLNRIIQNVFLSFACANSPFCLLLSVFIYVIVMDVIFQSRFSTLNGHKLAFFFSQFPM